MNTASLRSLRPLIEQFGIQRTYRAANGERVTSSLDAVTAVLEALGADTGRTSPQEIGWSRMIEPVIVAWEGRLHDFMLRLSANAARRKIEYDVTLEDGSIVGGNISAAARSIVKEEAIGRSKRVELSVTMRASLPVGYHELRVRTLDGEASALILSAPARCHTGEQPRAWGVFAPLYALGSKQKPIGDFGDLRSLMQWVAELDGDMVATLPVSAAFLRETFDPSPYSPASRLFWNELYLEVEGLRAQYSTDLIDYRTAAEAKRVAVEAKAKAFFETNNTTEAPEFREFKELYPNAREYARFRAAGEHFGTGWSNWPSPARNGRLGPADFAEGTLRYHWYAQFQAHQQLARLSGDARSSGVRLYLDMPLGVHPESFDVWCNRTLFVTGASAGAPPDPLFTRGQSWGFPPMHPVRMREDGYAYWRQVLQTQLRYAGMLRLDHVMALHRLYFVPQGCEATDGVYVRYPADELYAVLAIESVRHEAMIVGEDLGTVPAEVRKAMARRGVKRMFVVQFEAVDDVRNPIGSPPRSAVASLNTHDMPPFRAFWEGLDGALRKELGLIDDAGVAEVQETRQRMARSLSSALGAKSTLDAGAARTAFLRWLAASDADAVLVNLEDLWLETESQNVPGTSQERPNWRRRLKHSIDEIRIHSEVRALLQMVDAARHNTSERS